MSLNSEGMALKDEGEEQVLLRTTDPVITEDDHLKNVATVEGPKTLAEAQTTFAAAMAAHKQGRYQDSVRPFKLIFLRFPKEDLGRNAAYNVACGYALAGKEEKAIEWLEIALQAGYTNLDHLKGDADLASIRNHPKYLEIFLRK